MLADAVCERQKGIGLLAAAGGNLGNPAGIGFQFVGAKELRPGSKLRISSFQNRQGFVAPVGKTCGQSPGRSERVVIACQEPDGSFRADICTFLKALGPGAVNRMSLLPGT